VPLGSGSRLDDSRPESAQGFSTINIGRLFQAFLAPAIFVSATALLILSINVRLMGIVSRLRQFVHAHDAAKSGRSQEAEAYKAQIESIERRANLIRRSFYGTTCTRGYDCILPASQLRSLSQTGRPGTGPTLHGSGCT
jgi:hypothetical protein